jgi:SAM-dependent methyltransferase
VASLWELMRDCIPDDHAKQVTSRYYIDEAMKGDTPPPIAVDLGCGSGASASYFHNLRPEVRWLGIDIAGSPEARARVPGGELVVHYDGVRLPLTSSSVPLIYSHQVFEHVRYPAELVAEIARVLVPGGLFIGSTSQLEPYHSFSLWNYTPYGFRVLVEDAGLGLEEVRPSIDGMTLIRRAYEGRNKKWSRFFADESPLNAEINKWARKPVRRPALVNLRKLEFCGQFAFKVRKPQLVKDNSVHPQ